MKLPIESLAEGGLNAPRFKVDLENPVFDYSPGCAIFEAELSRGTKLECLAVIRGDVPTIVSFHGALLRRKYTLPRFERLKTLADFECNALFFSDPALRLNKRLELAWFTGWRGLNLHELMGIWISNFARGLGSNCVLLSGSSGGGFAALQTAPCVDDSIAVVFNPQTQLDKYLVGGRNDGFKAQHDYVKSVYPELLTTDGGIPTNWGSLVGPKASALDRYKNVRGQRIHYWTSPNDFHHKDHYEPFAQSCKQNENSLVPYIYETRPGHRPPSLATFTEAIETALSYE